MIMKRLFNLLFLLGGLLTFMGFISCSNDGIEEIQVKVEDKVECPGDLKPYIKLSKGDYTLKKLKSYKSLGGDKLSHIQLTVSFESVKSVEITDNLELILSIVDENYNQVNSKSKFKIDLWSSEAKSTIVSGLKSGEGKFSISISTEDAGVGDPVDADEWDEIKTKGKYIVISSSKASLTENQELEDYYGKMFEENPPSESEGELGPMPHGDSESDYDVSEDTSDNNVDFDTWLDSYEEYVDKYIAFMKKAKNGDASAMSEYPRLLESANKFSSKISSAKGNLSPSQWSRYMKIQQKMLQAAQNL